MTTQLIEAQNGNITPEVELVAKEEYTTSKDVMKKLANGRVVIFKNSLRQNSIPKGIGEGFSTNINLNIGTGGAKKSLKTELEKAQIAEYEGVDTIVDMSSGKGIELMRKKLLNTVCTPIGTVPMYQAVREATDKTYDLKYLTKEKLFSAVEKQAKDGVDFMCIHAAITKEVLKQYDKSKRQRGIISRCGSMLNWWIEKTNEENPFYEYFDELLEILKQYDVVLSLGSAMRSGCLEDYLDSAQMAELVVNSHLIQRARKAGVQTMVEVGGHIPINKIEHIIKTTKELTDFAPLYTQGPIVSDVAAGYDHITSSIGSAIAGLYGVNFICCTLPFEHLQSSNKEQIKEAIISSKISAHTIDFAKGNKTALSQNKKMNTARQKMDLEAQKKEAIDKSVF